MTRYIPLSLGQQFKVALVVHVRSFKSLVENCCLYRGGVARKRDLVKKKKKNYYEILLMLNSASKVSQASDSYLL